MLFNAIVPVGIEFQNREMKKKALGELVFESYRRAGLAATVSFLDRLKDFGFRNATRGGVSIGIEDLHIPAEKETLLREAEQRVERFQRAYQTGNITNGERYNKVIDTWTHANNDVADAMVKAMRESLDGYNPVFIDVRLRVAWIAGPDPATRGDARTHGEAPEEADGWDRRDHRESDQVELP